MKRLLSDMTKRAKLTGLLMVVGTLLWGCDGLVDSDPAGVLDQSPQDRYTGEVVWSDVSMAESVLNAAYRNLDIRGDGDFGPLMELDGVTDNVYFTHRFGIQTYTMGNIGPSALGPFGDIWFAGNNWENLYDNIQRTNTFLANIDDVLEGKDGAELASLEQTMDRMIGEARFVRAFAYTQLLRTYGGVPIITEPFELGADYSSVGRATFAETVDFISDECDQAASLLGGRSEMEMGEATKGAALALKSRLLLFAASDLTADGSAASEYVGYTSPDRTALWTRARDAAKAVMDLGTYSLENFGAPDQEAVAESYFQFFARPDLGSPEAIWGEMYLKASGPARQTNLFNGPNGLYNWGANTPTQELVDTYQMADGSDFFSHFEIDSDEYYVNTSSKYESPNPYDNRDPRFYGSVLYDQAPWQERFGNLQERDPVGVYDVRTRRVLSNGEVVSETPGIDTRQGPVVREDGSYTRYLVKKGMQQDVVGRAENNDNAWVEFRYAEILLNYAEASMELGQAGEAATYVNMIRNRAGMPDFTGDLEEALRYERRIELAFEDKRWYDLRRWKTMDEAYGPVHGMNVLETTYQGEDRTEVAWQRRDVNARRFQDRMYWIPLPAEELNRAPQLTQNPGY